MAKQSGKRSEHWARVVGEQARSGVSVRAYCRQAGVNEHSFYNWRRRLREGESNKPVRFALVEAPGRGMPPAGIELTLAGGETLRIAAGTDAATLRMVLAALRP
jgi:hypothetical protein